MQLPGFIGPSYTLRSPNVDAQRTLNLYPELNEVGSGKNREVAALVSTPGLRKIGTMGPNPNRCLYAASNGRAFALAGNSFSELVLGAPNIVLNRGIVDSTSGPAAMADNGTQLLLVAGKKGYVFTFADNTFTPVTDENFPKATAAAFLDQYLIVNDAESGRFQFAFGDALDWDGLDMATAEGSPDNLVTLLVDHRELALFGTQSTEMWWNVGDPTNPFARTSGGYLEIGIAAAETARKMDHSFFWLSQDKNGGYQVVRATQSSPQRISTHAVEHALNGYGDLSRATAYTYQSQGHSFYVLNCPGADNTWVYDVSTNLWHERNYTKPTGGYTRHRAENHCFVNGRHIVGDYENGNLYELQEESDTALSVDPQVMLQYSDDGGVSWSREKRVSAGKIGQRKHRAIWRRLGRSRDRVFRVRIVDPLLTDDGAPITRERVSPHVSAQDLHTMFFNSVQLDMESGTGRIALISAFADVVAGRS